MSNWYSIRVLTRKDVMVQAETQEQAEDIACSDFGDLGAHTEAKTEEVFLEGTEHRRVDRYIRLADEVSYEEG